MGVRGGTWTDTHGLRVGSVAHWVAGLRSMQLDARKLLPAAGVLIETDTSGVLQTSVLTSIGAGGGGGLGGDGGGGGGGGGGLGAGGEGAEGGGGGGGGLLSTQMETSPRLR